MTATDLEVPVSLSEIRRRLHGKDGVRFKRGVVGFPGLGQVIERVNLFVGPKEPIDQADVAGLESFREELA